MSNNTNSLFWIITGAVVILSSFILVNTSKESFFTKASEKFSGLFNNQAGIKTVNNNEENNLIEEKVDEEDSELKRYYGHEPNYKSLKITDEKYFEFDPIEGVITDYTGEESTIVFPYEIGGVEVKKIIIDNFWNNHVSSEMCKILLDEYLSGSDDMGLEFEFEIYKNEGSYKDGQCVNRPIITRVVFPNTVDEIGPYIFQYMQITELHLPPSLVTIGYSTFEYNQITKLDLTGLNNLVTIGGSSFAHNEIEGEVIIPDSVIALESNSFDDNNITKFVLSRNQRYLEKMVVRGNNLKEFYITNPQLEITDGQWTKTNSNFSLSNNTTIYYPKGSSEWFSQYAIFNYFNFVEMEE